MSDLGNQSNLNISSNQGHSGTTNSQGNLGNQNPPINPTIQDDWNFSNEREFIEEVLCTRFNFFLVFYSLVIAGFVTTTNECYKPLILILGTIISVLLALVIYRSHIKLDIILNDCLGLRSPNSKHPAAIVEQMCNARKPWIRKIFSVRWIIGWFIPLLCCISLFVGAILSYLGLI
jgi:hypothetical protein